MAGNKLSGAISFRTMLLGSTKKGLIYRQTVQYNRKAPAGASFSTQALIFTVGKNIRCPATSAPGSKSLSMNTRLYIAYFALFVLLFLGSCQSDSRGPGLEALPEEPVEHLYPGRTFLQTPALINGWVRQVNSEMEEFENKGPYTIARAEGNYEVTAMLAGGEIILLHTVTPGSLTQQWYYLNEYLVPTLREKGSTLDGEHFERCFFYFGPDQLLEAKERRAGSEAALQEARWYDYQPAAPDDFRLNPKTVRQSALDFVAGK